MESWWMIMRGCKLVSHGSVAALSPLSLTAICWVGWVVACTAEPQTEGDVAAGGKGSMQSFTLWRSSLCDGALCPALRLHGWRQSLSHARSLFKICFNLSQKAMTAQRHADNSLVLLQVITHAVCFPDGDGLQLVSSVLKTKRVSKLSVFRSCATCPQLVWCLFSRTPSDESPDISRNLEHSAEC